MTVDGPGLMASAGNTSFHCFIHICFNPPYHLLQHHIKHRHLHLCHCHHQRHHHHLRHHHHNHNIFIYEYIIRPYFISDLRRTMFYPGLSLPFSPGMKPDTTPAEKLAAISSELRVLQELIAKFRQLNVDDTEFACLKGIVIFKTGK